MKNRILVQLDDSPETGLSARWCLQDVAGQNLQSGSFEIFTSWLRAQQSGKNEVLRTRLLLSGEQVVIRSVEFAANEKKHLQKLLPFMLESQLAVDLSHVHVAFLQPDLPLKGKNADEALLAYTDKKQLQWRINALESLGLEVDEIYSIPSLLPAVSHNWSVQLDSDLCHLRAGDAVCASIERALLPVLIKAAIADAAKSGSVQTPSTLTVYVDSFVSEQAQDVVQELLQVLHECMGTKAVGISIDIQTVTKHWDCLDVRNKKIVNLRQGEFAAPLRLSKYWRQWQVPAIAAAVAITAVLVSAIVETQINQYRFRALEARIEQRYRQVMPEGVLVDAVQQLSTQVAQRRSDASGQSLISMLDAMLEPFENTDSLNLHRLSYNANTQTGGAAAEIQLSISAPGTAEILQLSESLNSAGWSAQAQNISRAGDGQQASLLVRGSAR